MAPNSKIAGSLLVLILLGGCADTSPPGVGAGTTSGRSATDHASAFPNQGELNEVAADVRRLGEAELADVYAGLAIDVYDDRVDVWATDPPRFAAAIDAMP